MVIDYSKWDQLKYSSSSSSEEDDDDDEGEKEAGIAMTGETGESLAFFFFVVTDLDRVGVAS